MPESNNTDASQPTPRSEISAQINPSRGNSQLLEQVPGAFREWMTMQLLGDPDNPQDRGSIGRYVMARNHLVSGGEITPEQATLVNQLPAIQNAAVQLLLGELHPEESSWERFNPARNYSLMIARLVDSGIVTHPDELANDSAIRSSVATIINNESNPARKAFLASQFTVCGIPPEIWQSREAHVNLLHGTTHPPARNELRNHELIPAGVLVLLTEQLLTTGDPKDQHSVGGVSGYVTTVERLVANGTLTQEQATSLSSLPEIKSAVVQILLAEIQPDPGRYMSRETDWSQFNPASNYSQMKRKLIADGIITDQEEFDTNPVIREAVTALIARENDDKRRAFLTQEFTIIGILSNDKDSY